MICVNEVSSKDRDQKRKRSIWWLSMNIHECQHTMSMELCLSIIASLQRNFHHWNLTWLHSVPMLTHIKHSMINFQNQNRSVRDACLHRQINVTIMLKFLCTLFSLCSNSLCVQSVNINTDISMINNKISKNIPLILWKVRDQTLRASPTERWKVDSGRIKIQMTLSFVWSIVL